MSIEACIQLQREKFVLDAQFSVPAQGVSALIGPSGCGKTTLLRAIAGLEEEAGGYIKVGRDVWQNEEVFLPAHKRRLGYVFQEPSLFPHFSVEKNLTFGYRRIPVDDRKITVRQVVDLLELEPLLGRDPASLSGGERQRVAIGRALLTSPRLLLMDEPLAALEEDRKKEILPFLERLPKELDVPVLYVSHDSYEITRIADHIVLLDKGTVLASGSISEILTRLDLPITRSSEASAVIDAEVADYDQKHHLSELAFDGGRFFIQSPPIPKGEQVRLQILARDVSLTLKQQTGTSILNILPARVDKVADEQPGQVMVRLAVGEVFLLSRITSKSAQQLDIKPGKSLYAQVKTVAVLG